MSEKHELAERLRAQLALGAALRSSATASSDTTDRRQRLRQWQSERLARTHRDLLETPRYRNAAVFFLSELYGPADRSKRYAEIERVMPLTVKILPVAGLEVVADAVELDALSESLDADMIEALGPRLNVLDDAAYGDAYRQTGRRADRAKQIGLIHDLGLALDRLSHLPMVPGTLKKMRLPAKIAGLSELQNFLQCGFEAFSEMQGTEEFVTTIVAREVKLSEALFAGDVLLLGHPATVWDTGMTLRDSVAPAGG
jgi:hypothetical protein